MLPAHVLLPLLDLERMLCREVGHRPFVDMRAEPVTFGFYVCLRCGHFWR